MIVCEGYYQPAGRAQRRPASLQLGTMLTLQSSEGCRLVDQKDVTVSEALGTIPLFITFPDGGRFVPAQDALFREWYFSQHKPGLVHRLERHKLGIVVALLLCVLSGAFWHYGALPWLSQVITRNVPVTVEQRLGEYVLQALEKSGDFQASALPARRQQALEALFRQALPAQMHHNGSAVKLKLMRSSSGANAFMLPDGTLILTDELVLLAKNDDAIAAVMLHEMGHHYHRHGMQMLVRSSVSTLLLMWMMGDVSGIGDTLLQSAVFLDQMRFSRNMEREADAFAMAGMRQQQRPLDAMIQIFQALKESAKPDVPGSAAWLSTHPSMEERLETLQAETGH